MSKFILASASPRRAEILRSLGLDFSVITPPIQELHPAAAFVLTPREFVLANATRKACAAGTLAKNDQIVLAADTEVYLDERIFGKPSSLQEAAEMLQALSGKTHQVWTGIVLRKNGRLLAAHAEVSLVTFKKIRRSDILDYLSSVHCFDKAGAYAVQEHREKIISHICGSLTNVMGLPKEVILSWRRKNIL